MPRNGSKPKSSKRPSKKSGKAVTPTGVGAKGGAKPFHYHQFAYGLFVLSETCYLYQAKLSDESAQIAD